MTALDLYQEVILDHSRHPHNFRKVDDANRQAKGHNPLCGDQYTVYVRLDGDRIADVGFEGQGCAISKASASLMTDDVKCAHGSTIGHLDEDAVFYLRTRGIEEWVARGILVYAFANEIVGAVRPRELQRRVRQLLHARLPSGAWIDDLP